jgi:hypothetical protein
MYSAYTKRKAQHSNGLSVEPSLEYEFLSKCAADASPDKSATYKRLILSIASGNDGAYAEGPEVSELQ